MRAFADLFTVLDGTTRTTAKVDALAHFFSTTPPADAAWAIAFLCGRKPKQVVSTAKLRAWAVESAGVSDWLFAECYDTVGDLAETITLLLQQSKNASTASLSYWVEERLLPLRQQDEPVRKARVLQAWDELNTSQRFVWNKLITGGFRVGVSLLLVVRALARVSGLPTATLSHRLMGDWHPTGEFFESLLAAESSEGDISRPYPFFLAHPLEEDPAQLGEVADWQVEWKWDGIRAQMLRRNGQSFLWTRGEELVTERYPELQMMAERLPNGTGIDGELLPWKNESVLPFSELQRRIGRKTLGKKLLQDVPVILMAYDLVEDARADLRSQPLEDRRRRLEHLVQSVADDRLRISPTLDGSTWEELRNTRQSSREGGVEGLMLKRKSSPYRVGRVRGDWWKWKVEPLHMDAVLTAAQRGHGKRASLYTDYTFSVWHEGVLVTIAKAYSGLTDAEIREVDAFVREHTLEKFGPVRTVKPELVFELGFEGIQPSSRHKSGVAVRFPRILRRRTDKLPGDADTLEQVKRLLLPGVAS